MITIEQHLDNVKKITDKGLIEAKKRPLTPDELKKLFIDSSAQLKVNPDKLKNILTEIENLFDLVPTAEIRSAFVQHFDELSRLDGTGFKTWQDSIQFNDSIIDELKFIHLCSLYNLEFIQLASSAISICETERQRKFIYLQCYSYLVEGFYSKALNIFIYAIVKIEPSGKLKYKLPKMKHAKKLNNYIDVSILSLGAKLFLIEKDTKYKELNNIAKECNRKLRNAVVHQEFRLDETNDIIVYKDTENNSLIKMKFSDFINSAQRLSDFCLIISLSLHYYSMKCNFKSKGLLS